VTLTVSVIIPVFNCETTIERAILSVIHQTRRPQEIIIVNDAGTDQSVAIAKSIAQDAPIPIHIHDNEINVGPGVSRNLGWAAATSDLVAFLDADDVWHPQKLEIQVSVMETKSNLMMTCHDRTVGSSTDWTAICSGHIGWRVLKLRDFMIRNCCATPSVILRRDISERFSSTLRYAEDYGLWLSVSAKYGNVYFADCALVNCANPAYGGPGLSGKMLAMYRGELRAFHIVTKAGTLSKFWLPVMYVWSTLKFVVRLVDHKLLHDRLQRSVEV
jgi:glycosyltransferase involved in cell wall biosynthesis